MSSAELLDDLPSRYVIGIDLGTTNSAVCYVDTQQQPWQVRVLSVPQLVAPGQMESLETLPSFHYQPIADEAAGGKLRLPWSGKGANEAEPSFTVGAMARDYGSGTPGRMIASAKSWLCHTGVDRTADLLPWHGAADVERLSPVEVSSRYLQHVRAAWNDKFRSEPLEKQDVVLTLPASFDEVARELTVEAAARAGLPRITLIEEPQAAFYAWIYKHSDGWEQLVSPGQKILVCDIGGGTSDFTLIRVRRVGGDAASWPGLERPREAPESSAASKVQFHRVAVGEHLILGGDNFDLALAQHLETKLGRGKLPPRQWDVLLRLSRQLKEEMLSETGPEKRTVALPGTGSKLIGGSLQMEITRDEVRQVLVDGFMPRVALDDRPATRRSGFQEFGLPYAADAAITRYLAAFLTAHRNVAIEDAELAPGVDAARPDVLLLNGGVFDSPVLRERLVQSLSAWFPTANGQPWRPLVLENDRLDLAVARGAAYYGMVRRGEGVKIAASLARTYYLGVEAEPPSALCLMPGSAEPGQDITLPQQFELLVSEPAEFQLFTSSTRLVDRPGELVAIDREQMTALPPIRTALKTRRRSERGIVTVQVHAKLTEIGTLDLWCSEVGGERSWRLQFDVRSATQTDIEAHQSAAEAEGVIDESAWQAAADVLQRTFGVAGKESPDGLVKRLNEAVGADRSEWPTSLLRRMWELLIELEPGRRRSAVHEARWLNLLGYSLRPGYGLAVDDWRVAETWKTAQSKLAHGAATSRTESLILWRRIAGGLTAGQQRALAEPLLATVRALHKRFATSGGKPTEGHFSPHEATEVLRLLGSLELLSGEVKQDLGRQLIDLLPKRKLDALRPAIAWAIGRLGAREPVYGPLNTVVPIAEVGHWLERLFEMEGDAQPLVFAVVQLARRTDDRYRDPSDALRDKAVGWLERNGAPEHARKLVEHGGQLDADEQNRVFGESLPKGLRVSMKQTV